MQHISELLGKSEKFHEFIARGKKARKWYQDNGYIYTNFGWLHKDWVHEGVKMRAISSQEPYASQGIYSIVVNVKDSFDMVREGRKVIENKKEYFDLTNFNEWLKFIDKKRYSTFIPTFKPEEIIEPTVDQPYINAEGEPTPF